jgi:elongation of very long chain fatty acids protein 6
MSSAGPMLVEPVLDDPSAQIRNNNDSDGGYNGGYVSLGEVLFADEWNLDRTTAFMQNNWVATSFKITIVYLAVVYFGQMAMRHRKPFDGPNTNAVLALWNFTFSAFSGWAAFRLLPELFSTFREHGFVGSYCHNGDYYTDPMTGYWGWMFVMSKMPELGDTVFLILRKKPVIFLHWYHHALTFLYATLTYAEMQAWCRWSLALNLSVHTVMYFYFGAQALKIKFPRQVAKFITTIQILQFVIQCYIYTQLVHIKATDSVPNCAVNWRVLGLGAVMYLSYLYLFARFFYNSYLKPRPAKVKPVGGAEENNEKTKKVE